ncbi:TM1802 family CRISPR-associated protein [Desulfoscipio geothermicus]|uniref:CRISPR-associated protein TM1802 (Cas_TM1802) n=1 Tax=Desulfoscipio geothermicus DSM 3669 TaxID=1121426 RepID=A0A1I6EDL6_9FIRM|nr:TM1802 family CRISPR-associated protein [Desulfoscipio geothermicus]SFR15850.1 CRISPR-associated protein TM1802 (cas_TM1802) [Desulfoscipio geothermicus DSM 3669]
MFLEKLISIGEPFLAHGMTAAEILHQVTDVSTDGRFLENVIVVELAREEDRLKYATLPLMTWGEYNEIGGREKKKGGKKKKAAFVADTARGLALPYALASGGNPTVPQGRYGVAVYPAYPNSVSKMTTSNEVARFLRKRLDKTLNLPVDIVGSDLEAIAGQISDLMEKVNANVVAKENQGYTLIAIVFPEDDETYLYMDRAPVMGDRRYILVGESELYPGKYIVADVAKLENCFWESKMAEGMEKGRREKCSICGKQEEAVSPYCKAWNWLSYTWDAPLSERFRGDKPDLSGAVGALCRSCYSSLIMGAGIFSEISAPLPYYLTRELFLPVASATGRDSAKKSKTRLPAIHGCALVLPFRKGIDVAESGEMLKEALDAFRSKNMRKGKNDLALAAITGFEAVLPGDFNSDDYRLTIVYYQASQADVQLRAVIEDVLPSTLRILADYMPQVADEAAEVKRKIAVTETDFMADNYRSLFYILIRAYGGGYLWHTLRSVLNRRPVNRERFVRGAALRMNGYAGRPDDRSFWGLREEVAFYLAFGKFLNFYNNEILKEGSTVSDWRQMLDKIAKTAPDQLTFSNVEELGFAAGYLTNRFGRWYYYNTGGNKEKKSEGKDFIKHRVMTFGSKLTPDMVWRKALSRFQEYAVKLDINLPDDFRRRAGVVESEFRRLRQQVERNRDEFMGAFWSGYMLAPEAAKEGS